MKYKIPNLELMKVLCPETYSPYEYPNIFNCIDCPIREEKCINELLKRIRNTIEILCDKNNEEKFCEKVRCNNCDGTYVRTPGGFICEDCGDLFQPSKKQIKSKLNEEYEEIDYTELNKKIHEIETKIKLLDKLQETSQEEKKFITDKINSKNENNIINFDDIKGNKK